MDRFVKVFASLLITLIFPLIAFSATIHVPADQPMIQTEMDAAICIVEDTIRIHKYWQETSPSFMINISNCGSQELNICFRIEGDVDMINVEYGGCQLVPPGEWATCYGSTAWSFCAPDGYKAIFYAYDQNNPSIADSVVILYTVEPYPPQMWCLGPIYDTVHQGDVLPNSIPLKFDVRVECNLTPADYCIDYYPMNNWLSITGELCGTAYDDEPQNSIMFTTTSLEPGTYSGWINLYCPNCRCDACNKSANKLSMTGSEQEVHYTILPRRDLWYVNASNISGPYDGSDVHPFIKIQDGINAAVNGDTVLVAPGTYTGDGNRDIDLMGKQIVLKSAENRSLTIIDVQATSTDRHRAFTIYKNEDTNTVIDGFTIKNGFAPIELLDGFSEAGGGIICAGSASFKMVNCSLTTNNGGYGAALFCLAETHPVVLANNIFCNNIGDAIHFEGSFAMIDSCVINYNAGHGIYAFATWGPTIIKNSTISNNDSSGISSHYYFNMVIDSTNIIENGGRGIECQEETRNNLVLTNSHIAFNKKGGMYLPVDATVSGSCAISNSTFSNNTAITGGAIEFSYAECQIKIDSCIFINNDARLGGAIYYGYPGTPEFRNCLFYNNRADSGGAIFYRDQFGGSTLNGCTFVSNTASLASAIYTNSIDIFTLQSSIIAFGQLSSAFYYSDSAAQSNIEVNCTDIYGNDGGDWLGPLSSYLGTNGNISANPLFCNPDSAIYSIYSSSPCAPANNSCGVLMGALNVGCEFQGVTIHIENDTSLGHILNHTPLISWNYKELNSYPQTQYEIAIGTDNDWAYAEMWNPAPIATSDTFVTYAGAPLINGQTYYMRLRVHNGVVWSNWYETLFRMNSLPTVPTQTFPDSGTIVNTAVPILYVNNATDAENDILTYDYEAISDSAYGDLIIVSGSDIAQTPDSTGWIVNAPLVENWKYWWRSRAFDQFEKSNWSGIQSFWVNAVEEPPSASSLIRLPDTLRNMVFDMLPDFNWTQSLDPDPLDTVHYTLYLALDTNFQYIHTIDNINQPSFQMTDSLLFGTKYWWKVKATDSKGNFTNSTNILSFRTWKLGDANGDWGINLLDVSFIINALYRGGPKPNPKNVGDFNGDCKMNLLDVSYLINYLYRNGPAPKIGCE